MKDHEHDDLKPSSEAPKTEEPKLDSTSTADYTSLSDLLDGTSIDEVYPEELPLNPLPDVPESGFSDNGIDYSDIHYDNVEPDTPANLVLDKGLAPDLYTTTSSTTTTTSMIKTTTTTTTTTTTEVELTTRRLLGKLMSISSLSFNHFTQLRELSKPLRLFINNR